NASAKSTSHAACARWLSPVSGSLSSPSCHAVRCRIVAENVRECGIPFSQLRSAYLRAPNCSTRTTAAPASHGKRCHGSLPPSCLTPCSLIGMILRWLGRLTPSDRKLAAALGAHQRPVEHRLDPRLEIDHRTVDLRARNAQHIGLVRGDLLEARDHGRQCARVPHRALGCRVVTLLACLACRSLHFALHPL